MDEELLKNSVRTIVLFISKKNYRNLLFVISFKLIFFPRLALWKFTNESLELVHVFQSINPERQMFQKWMKK